VQIVSEVTDNVIYTYIGEVIIVCVGREDTGGKQYIHTAIMWSLTLQHWKENAGGNVCSTNKQEVQRFKVSYFTNYSSMF
jgi:hypothetical protein